MPGEIEYPRGDASQQDLSVVDLATVLLRHRRLILALPTVLFLAVVTIGLALPRTYRTTTSFVPYAAGGETGAAGLAAQLGFALSGPAAGQSPDFYAELLQSREILSDIVDAHYEFTGRRGWPFRRVNVAMSGTLADILEIEEATPARSRERAMRSLTGMMNISTGRTSGIVTLAVSSPWPELSQQVAARALELIGTFNQTRRQSQAAAEREFVHDRLAEVRPDLRQAEDALEGFLRSNRAFQNSPQLVFEHDRLQRDVAMRQAIFTSLSQAYEQARIDEVRNTPVITVVHRPDVPALPDRRGLTLKGLIALAGGGVLGVLIALGRETIASQKRLDPEGFDQFQGLKESTLSDIRRPWRLLAPPSEDPKP